MRGNHHIVIETERVKYEFDIRRNITLIQGESATGKTTLINILQEYGRKGIRSGIRLQSDVNCIVYNGMDDQWRILLESITRSIIFFDEGFSFIYTEEFAAFVKDTDNYYVFITRRALKNLPYSIREIYGIKTSGRYHFPEKIYHEFYPLYTEQDETIDMKQVLLLIEDSKSGFQFYRRVFGGVECVSADGNANIYKELLKLDSNRNAVVIADGAAFGAFVNDIVAIKNDSRNIALYFPESFEWLILKAGVISDRTIEDILNHPENYIESREFFSWERYFTHLLENVTATDRIKQYHKSKLGEYYLTQSNIEKVVKVLPEQLQAVYKTE